MLITDAVPEPMPLNLCSHPIALILALFGCYPVAVWLIARATIRSCLCSVGKEFNHFAFWFTFFGWTTMGGGPDAIKQNLVPVYGMDEHDMETIVFYRRMFEKRFWCATFVFVIGFFALSTACRL